MSCTEQTTQSSDILATSNVTSYDGSALGIVSLPSSPSLNDTITAIDTAIQTVNNTIADNSSEVTYDGPSSVACLTLTNGGNLNTIISELATEICNNQTSISGLGTDGITYTGTTIDNSTPTGSSGINGVIEGIDDELGTITTNIDSKEDSTSVEISRDIVASGGVIKPGGGVSTPTGLTTTIDDGSGGSTFLIDSLGRSGGLVSEVVTLFATKDNYIDLTYNDIKNTPVTVGAGAPSIPSGYVRAWKLETDGSGVVASTDFRTTTFVDTSDITDDAVTTSKITDLNVTGAKMESIVAGATVGDSNIITATFDAKGRITAASDKFNIGTLVDKDILQYDLSSNKWTNQALPTSNVIQSVKVSLTTAQILTLNTTPIEIIAAPGVGFASEITSCSFRFNYDTAAFATNTNIRLICPSASLPQYDRTTFLSNTSDKFVLGNINTSSSGINLVENEAINITVPSGDPTGGGNSTLDIYITYRIINL